MTEQMMKQVGYLIKTDTLYMADGIGITLKAETELLTMDSGHTLTQMVPDIMDG